MANGDNALAAGMDILSGDDDRRNGWDEINKTRDYILEYGMPDLVPIAQGGTGATTAPAARAALGVPATADVPKWTDVSPPGAASASGIARYSAAGRLQAVAPAGVNDVATVGWVEERVADLDFIGPAGGTITGQLYLPNAIAATSGFTVAYINSDGRVSRGSSSERYKKYISTVDPSQMGDVWPDLVRYQMRNGDGSWRYGYIAERLAEHPDQHPFVIYATAPDETGDLVATSVPESIDFISLLMVQNAQLRQALELLAQRIDALEAQNAAN